MNRFQVILKVITNSLTRKGLLAAIVLATVLLTAGYVFGKLWLQVPVVFLLGILWAVCVLRDMHWVASLLFMLLLGAAAVGYMARLSPILMLAGGCASAIAWDLHYFEARLLDLDEPSTKEMEKQHLLRLLIVMGISFLVIAAASMVRIRVQFIVLVGITVLAILIINQVMLLMRKAGRPAPPKE
jgi:hypothetical protein